ATGRRLRPPPAAHAVTDRRQVERRGHRLESRPQSGGYVPRPPLVRLRHLASKKQNAVPNARDGASRGTTRVDAAEPRPLCCDVWGWGASPPTLERPRLLTECRSGRV